MRTFDASLLLVCLIGITACGSSGSGSGGSGGASSSSTSSTSSANGGGGANGSGGHGGTSSWGGGGSGGSSGCTSNGDCTVAATPVCEKQTHACVACLKDGDCAGNASGGVCDTATHACVECTSNASCSGQTPQCDTTAHACVACFPACSGSAACDVPTNRCIPATCHNGTLDMGETDIDCGGPCLPCANAQTCSVASDCQSGSCSAGHCAAWATSVSPGGDYTCALTVAGGVECWGYNIFGQLGNGTDVDAQVPADVSGLGVSIAAISSGGAHTCALTTTGGVKCWGQNDNGELGNSSTTQSDVPVDVSGLLAGVIAIASGGNHSCALTATGGLKCWGYNAVGQLGNNDVTSSDVPVDVMGLTSGVAAVSAGSDHTCALTTAGGVKCWGRNDAGEVGDGSTTNSYVPVDVSGLTSGIAAISAGGEHTCALTTGGGVKCWGFNSSGQLGNHTKIDSHVPVDVAGLTSGVAAVTAGGYHTCALTTAGAVQCWGRNSDGQLGIGSTVSADVPAAVPGLTATNVSAEQSEHTCAVTTSGAVLCWGDNSKGELGNASTTKSTVPVAVHED